MDWIDKFDLKVEVSQDELKSTLTNIAAKAVRYELITSILKLILIIVCMFLIYKLFKYITGIANFKESIQTIKKINKTKDEGTITKILETVIYYIIVTMLITFAISQIVDIIECFVFPEKIVLEFIGRYLN
jgi:hypothetical protein